MHSYCVCLSVFINRQKCIKCCRKNRQGWSPTYKVVKQIFVATLTLKLKLDFAFCISFSLMRKKL
jgi:hypothetical protein